VTSDAGKRAEAYHRFVELIENDVPVVTTAPNVWLDR
jgi:hypothetical protein